MSDLFTATRPHDLPPRWDGQPVEWGEWHYETGVFVCPPPRERHVCHACGSTAERPTSQGTYRRGPARGKVVGLYRGRVGALVRLHVYRCPDCRHDQVFEPRSLTWWDLDPDDYQDAGSYA